MAATIGTMTILNTKCMATTTTPPKTKPPPPPPPKHFSLFSIKSLTSSKSPLTSLAATALAGAVFSALSSADPALAAQQLANIAADSGGSDSRGLALLLPIVPAIAWVLFNILQPALNQVNRMRSSNGVVVGLGMGSVWAATGLTSPPHAAAGEVAALADAAGDNRGQLLLFVIAPAILWVLYNILQPALNQLNKMRSE